MTVVRSSASNLSNAKAASAAPREASIASSLSRKLAVSSSGVLLALSRNRRSWPARQDSNLRPPA
jgi:hypothetical protein